MRFALVLAFLTLFGLTAAGEVHLITDEAEAVLHLLDIQSNGGKIADADWQKLFATDGYKRLKARELGMKRKFEDADFEKFVQSPDLLAKRKSL